MFSPEHLNQLLKEVMSQLGSQDSPSDNQKDLQRNGSKAGMQQGTQNAQNTGNSQNGTSTDGKNKKVSISPAQALVIAGILGGALDVESVLVDKAQQVQIILLGSLKREIQKPKTELELMMDKIGTLPFDQVMKVMLDRFT